MKKQVIVRSVIVAAVGGLIWFWIDGLNMHHIKLHIYVALTKTSENTEMPTGVNVFPLFKDNDETLYRELKKYNPTIVLNKTEKEKVYTMNLRLERTIPFEYSGRVGLTYSPYDLDGSDLELARDRVRRAIIQYEARTGRLPTKNDLDRRFSSGLKYRVFPGPTYKTLHNGDYDFELFGFIRETVLYTIVVKGKRFEEVMVTLD